ncbi:heme peroxidase [Limtongia smithiae]|uniref:heme peroxidase n=1 Tax=Limtongia smithiae TaxID=1125753 RepID=UPI0034CFFFA6
MSFVARPALRAASRAAALSATRSRLALAVGRTAVARSYSTEAPKTEAPKAEVPPPKGSGNTLLFTVIAAALVGGGGYYYYSSANDTVVVPVVPKPFVPTYEDYKKVYDDIAASLESDDYDDGSYGPVLIRLAWHASGTYDAASNTGGSSGATMRFAPEALHGANAGLEKARDHLEPIHAKYPWISYGDLWTLAGVASVQELGGPTIKWRPGRHDEDASACTPDGRLPDGDKGADHVRSIFYRMGFNDQEIVALIGAHALGRCHTDRSGFDGPWTFAPTYLTNDFYKLLKEEKWHWRKWKGPAQYQDSTNSLMMLPADMCLVKDKKFKVFVDKYANSNDDFFADFSKVFCKLLELGVEFKPNQESWTFTATNA